MKCLVLLIILMTGFTKPPKAKADIWGADVAVLAQILVNTIQQLYQLMALVETTQDNLNLMQDIHRGLHDSLQLAQRINPRIDPEVYKTWRTPEEALRGLKEIYGEVVTSKNAQYQRQYDANIAESISLNNSIYKYAEDLDRVSGEIERYSHQVSPDGAQKLTAQGMGLMLEAMNQSLRVQASGLKLQAQKAAIENRNDKELTRHMLDVSAHLSKDLKDQRPSFRMPSL